ncbi:MAG: NAD(P)/FAD-dependent oxidoreductase [Bacillota bacterium]
MGREPKVAIVGAGLSGLACAIGLQRRGIKPVIFEWRDVVGGRFPNVEVCLRVYDLPAGDAIHYLREHCGLDLWIPSPVSRLVLHSRNAEAVLRGPLGHITLRGNQEGAWEKQLARLVEAPIRFGERVDPLALGPEFDSVVVADGQETVPKRLGIWHEAVSLRGSSWIIEGPVAADEVHVWLDPALAGQGYAYILPWRGHTAMAATFGPDVTPEAHSKHQDNFLRVLERRGFSHRPLEGSQINAYSVGYPERYQEGRYVFTGNAGGCMDPLAGFGQVQSIISGFAAARAIVEGRVYGGIPGATPRRDSYIALRRLINGLSAGDMDHFVATMAALPFRDWFLSTKAPLLQWMGAVVQMWLGSRVPRETPTRV